MRKKRYADAFKKQLIALVAQGRTPEQLAREYEPTAQTIRNWVNEAQKQQPASELEKDRLIKELKAENARLREEREILEKTAAWFAMESTSTRKKGSNS